ncbi:Ubiquinone biosynthesis O-methyltransferase [Symmachiella macrocystis]|uniref:Ubiquinone biosynthesis O-methyltransferase n=1 Tax=Symmachiella macrocystis TaxID=2527985 RepID=A0A5C6BC75_9PLAN|nr:methyltransferase domain-containing protein [Symmachiella macrocystis]TWU09683.1 Ubiquinone biosynthesis O-methyltransferase [Symmachiella macrocystis]
MNSTFYEQLRGPESGGQLRPDAEQSQLVDESSGDAYPILDGIPRFVASEHLASFGLQWNKYEVAHDDEDRATFQAKTGMPLADLTGLRVLDAGCGGGRYSKIAGEAGAKVIGADHSTAVEKAAQLCGHLPDVNFVQADLKKLPLEPASFDFVFSIGVMHHDADTRAVFDSVAKFVKPGGKMAVWLYRRNQWWQEWINDSLRRRTTTMPAEKLEPWCRRGAWLGGLPVIGKTLNKIANFSNHPNWENRVCDTFDWYAPQYQYHHTVDELSGWFRDAGFEQLRVLPPEKTGRFYRWTYERNLLIGSGVNVQATRVS